MRSILAALALLTLMQVCGTAPASAQGLTGRPLTPYGAYLASSYSYRSSAALAAAEQQYETRFLQQRQVIDSKENELARARTAITRLKGDKTCAAAAIAQLERELTDLQSHYLTILAAKDAEFALLKASLERQAEDILQTDDGQKLLADYLDGKPGSAEAVIAFFDNMATKRLRSGAEFALDALGKGQLSTSAAITQWEKVVNTGPGLHRDWFELSRLYLKAHMLERARYAAEQALKTAKGDRELTAGYSQLALALQELGDLLNAAVNSRQAVVIDRSLILADASSKLAQHDLVIDLILDGDILRAQKKLTAAAARYTEAFDFAMARGWNNTPSSFEFRLLSGCLDKLGDIALDQQNFSTAITRYQDSLRAARALAARDPGASGAQADVATMLNKIGDAIVKSGSAAVGNPAATTIEAERDALVYYDEALAITQRLAAADPSSWEAQRDYLANLVHIASIGGAKSNYAMVVAQLQAMKARGQFIPGDEAFLTEARKLAAQEYAPGNRAK